MEPREGEPWPAVRSAHAACYLGYAGDHINLPVTGGIGRGDEALNDTWLFNMSSKKWKEVRHNYYMTQGLLYYDSIIRPLLQ